MHNLRLMTWFTQNTTMKKILDFENIQLAVEIARTGLIEDMDSVSQALWTMAYLSDTPDENVISLIFNNGAIISDLVKYLTANQPMIFIPALRALANLMTSDQVEIPQKCLYYDVLTHLENLCKEHGETMVSKETMWLLSNFVESGEYA